MKLARLGPVGDEAPVVMVDGLTFDAREVTADFDAQFFASGGMEELAAAIANNSLPTTEPEGRRIGAPISRPGAVICIGMNYAAHAAESGSVAPPAPIMFFKPPNTVTGPNDSVLIPPGSVKTDWEVELGVVIQERALYLQSPSQSRRHIAGFVVANDVSEREFQLERSGGQWSKGKSAPGFTPIGPWLVTPEDVDASNLRISSWVNSDPRQDSSTADLIFDVDYLIWYLSQYMALDPGDLILTGTPAGVGLSGRFPYLTVGDVVELEITGLGRQRQSFAATPQEMAPAHDRV